MSHVTFDLLWSFLISVNIKTFRILRRLLGRVVYFASVYD